MTKEIKASEREIVSPASRKEIRVVRSVGIGDRAIEHPGMYNGFLGISLGSRISNEDLLLAIKLGLGYLNNILILVDDWEERINKEVFDALTEQEAIATVLPQGEIWRRRYERVSSRLPPADKNRLSFKLSSEYFRGSESGEIKEILEYLTLAYNGEEGPKFYDAINDQIQWNIAEKIAKYKQITPKAEYDNRIKLLPRYLLEEMALTILLVEKGYQIEVQQGNYARPLEEIYEDKGVAKGGRLFPRYPWLAKYLSRRLQRNYGHINFEVRDIPAGSLQPVEERSTRSPFRFPHVRDIFHYLQVKIKEKL